MDYPLIISNFLILFIVFFTGTKTLKTKKYKPLSLFIFLLLLFVLQNLSNLNGPTHFTTIFSFFNFFALLYVIFETSYIESLLISIFLVLFVSISEFFSMVIMGYIGDLNAQTDINSILYLVSLLLSDLFFFLFSICFSKLKNTFQSVQLTKYFWVMLIMPALTLVAFMLTPNYFDLIEHNQNIVICFSLLVLSNLVELLLFYKVLSSIKIQKDLEKRIQEKEKNDLKFNLLSQQYHENFNLLHTLLHSYTELNNLLIEANYTQLGNKINELSNQTFKDFNSLYSQSYILNILISNKIDILRSHNINIETKLIYSDFDFISLEDQSIFFEELLNISINLCKLNPTNNRTIYFKSYKKMNNIVLEIYFYCSNDHTNLYKDSIILKTIQKQYKLLFLSKYSKNNNVISITFAYNTLNRTKRS